jgi:hypothetical protein
LQTRKNLLIIEDDYNAGVYVYGNADHIPKKSLFATGEKAALLPQGKGRGRLVCG